MNDFSIEKLTEQYVDDVFKLESKLIGNCDKSSITKSLESETLNYFVLLKDKTVVGFFECMILAPEIELYDIAVKKEEQGNGYSKLMMDYLLELAKKINIRTIFLEVNNMNNKAIGLYEKYGFKKYFERLNYYGKNEDAILMKLDLFDK